MERLHAAARRISHWGAVVGGGLIMLAAVIGLYVVTAQSDAFTAGTFDFREIVTAVSSGQFVVDPAVMNLLFGGFMFAFAVKAPLWPLHRWLPDAAVEATRC